MLTYEMNAKIKKTDLQIFISIFDTAIYGLVLVFLE